MLRIRQFIEPADLFHGLNRGASARLSAQEVLNKQAGEILTVTKSQDSPKNRHDNHENGACMEAEGGGLLILLSCSYSHSLICFEQLTALSFASDYLICRLECTKSAPKFGSLADRLGHSWNHISQLTFRLTGY